MKKLLLFILIPALILSPARASFDDLGVGARAPGMADTFVGVADDANAIYYNPAGLSQLGEQEVMTEYGQLVRGLDDGSSFRTTYVGFAQPLHQGRRGTLGLAYHNFQAANLVNERTLFLSYGWRLKVQPLGLRGVWSAGGSLKQLYRQYEPDRYTENALNDVGTGSGQTDPLFAKNGYASTAYSADLGGLYQFGRDYRYSAGLSLMNVNRPDVSLGGDNDKAPLITKLGLGYRPAWGLLSVEFRRARRLASSPDTDVAIGGERKFKLADWGAFLLRSGYAEGSRGFKAVTAGMSYVFARAQLDYAFNFPIGNLSDTKGNHRLGFSFRLGTPDRLLKLQGPESESQDLLKAFERDSRAVGLTFDRAFLQKSLTDRKKIALWQFALSLLPLEDPERSAYARKIMSLNRGRAADASFMKDEILSGMTEADVRNIEDALVQMRKGNTAFALARLTLASSASRANGTIEMLEILGHTAIAARSYRAQDIDMTLNELRQILQAVPDDEVILAAYRKLLAEKTPPEAAPVEPALPEAPATLVAPTAVGQSTAAAQPTLTELEKASRAYATSLGYYIMRKEAGATAEERKTLLQQMKVVYQDQGLDLKFVQQELDSITATEKPAQTKPAPAPAAPAKAKPMIEKKKIVPSEPVKTRSLKAKPVQAKPAPKKQTPEVDLELDRSWRFYREAVGRNITDHERIEILESIVNRFGGDAGEGVRKELERLRNRVK